MIFFINFYDSSEAVGRSLLPHIIGVKQLVGMATVSCHGITRKTTEVFGGLGDMQCAMFSCCPSPKEAGTLRSVCITKNL